MIYQHTFSFENNNWYKKKSNHSMYDFIAASRNNYQPTLVEGDDASRVLEKVNEIK